MNDNGNDFLSGEISMADIERQARIKELSDQVTSENMHDGSPTSLEFARLAVEIFDGFLESLDFLLASPYLPTLPLKDKEIMEAYAVEIRGRRAKAQRAVEINLQKSVEAKFKG